jgi:hypothetical protein
MKTWKGSVRAERLKRQNSPRLKIAHANFNDLITFAKVCRFACLSLKLENWRADVGADWRGFAKALAE